MPAPLQVDWSLAHALFQEGFSLRSVSNRTGIPYGALLKRKKRGNWAQLVLPTPAAVQHTTTRQRTVARVQDKSEAWTGRVENVLDRHLSVIETESGQKGTPLALDKLEQLVGLLNTTDLTARRTLGLDVARTDQHMTIHLAGEMQPIQVQDQSQEVIEVQCVPEEPKL